MKDKFHQAFTDFSAAVRESVAELSSSAKEKTTAVIDEWLTVFPELEKMGLIVTSYGISLALSPSLEVELSGDAASFDEKALEQYMSEYREDSSVMTVLKTIRMTRRMYLKLRNDVHGEIFVKVRVKVPPQVQVFFGRPVLL